MNTKSLPSNWSELCSSNSVMIGLKRYAFRSEYSSMKIKALGFKNLEIVYGFDGWEENAETVLNQFGIECAPTLNPGHKGFSYSHIRLWKRIVDESLPYMIIFEDDCIGHLDLPNGLGQQFWDATPKEFDICYLGNMMNPADANLIDPKSLVVRSETFTTHAYIVTYKGAVKLLALLKELSKTKSQLKIIDLQLHEWQLSSQLNYVCWNGTHIQKSYPTYDESLPWQAFADVILPVKDSGLFWQNIRLGTTLANRDLKLLIPT